MSARSASPWRPRAWVWLALAAVLLLALAAAAHAYRPQLGEQRQAALRDTAAAKKQQQALEGIGAAEAIGRLGVLAEAARVHLRQSTVDISDALERLQREEQDPLRLSYRIGEPVPRPQPVATLALAERSISIELGSITEAPIPAFLMGLPASLHGALHVEQLQIERLLAFDDELLARLNQGERPDVLLARLSLRVGSITGPAPVATAAPTPAPAAKAARKARP